MSSETDLGRLQDFLFDELQKEIGEKQANSFLDSSNHPFTCRCGSCLSWWARMGPDGYDYDDPNAGEGDYGPFMKDEVNAEQEKLGIQVTP